MIIIFIFLLLILLILLMASIIINYLPSFTKIGGGNDHKFYYTISGENGLDFSKLRNILSEYNFYPKPITEVVHVSFGTFYTDNEDKLNNYDPLFIKQRAAIKNVLNGHNVICDKTLFYKTIKSLIPIGYKYIPYTYTVEEFDEFYPKNADNSIYILKKKNAAQQKGVLTFSTMKEYLVAKKELHIHKNNGIISKYITNPLTVDGKKMHLRVYILATIQSGIIRCYVYDKYKICTAEDKYIKEDWLNPKIHISGPEICISKQYIWPDDVDNFKGRDTKTEPQIELLNNMNECFRVLCQGISLSNLTHYADVSDSGYHLYGADILLTDDNNVFILEVNKRPGFGWIKTSTDTNFSYNLFLFILNNTVFPFLGIKRIQIPITEVCINGNLAPFSQLLIGKNKSILIPITDATNNEISIANAFNYNNEKLKLNYLLNINNCKIEAYLISNNNNIIGYLVLINNWINILITKEFQNRGIGTAMIGLVIEMQAYRNYPHNPTVYIKILHDNISNFIYKISKKLQFTNEYTFLSRKCRIKNNIINNKHITALSSNLILNKNGLIVEKLASYINKYMIETKYLQFVHLSYSTLARKTFFTNMQSTGSRFDNDFLLKGAELKSAIKFLSFKYISYSEIYKLNKLFNDENKLFDKEIQDNKFDKEIQDNKIYKITGNISNNLSDTFYYVFNKNELLNKIKDVKITRMENIEKLKNANYYEDTKSEKSYENNENFIRINEYYPPFLLDGRLMALRIFIILYISGNGLKKCYIFDKYQIVTAKNKYSIDDKNNWNDKNILQTSTLSTDKLYNWPEDFKDSDLKFIIKNNTLEPFIKKIAELLIKCEYIPRPESNSGFTEFFINIKFTKQNNEYYPIINELSNAIQFWKFTNMTIEEDMLYNNKFSKNYYKWVVYSVIFPHFGISKQQQPMAIDLLKPNNVLNLKIISLLSLNFYKKDKIYIYYDSKKIGYIDLILHNFIIQLSHIELDKEYQKKGIAINVIYLLMDILAAYYAPNRISLKFIYTKEMYSIAYKLLFHKIDNFFIRECRL